MRLWPGGRNRRRPRRPGLRIDLDASVQPADALVLLFVQPDARLPDIGALATLAFDRKQALFYLCAAPGDGVVEGRRLHVDFRPRYVVRRGQPIDMSDAFEIASTTATLFEDPDAANDPNSYSYKVFAVDACGREE